MCTLCIACTDIYYSNSSIIFLYENSFWIIVILLQGLYYVIGQSDLASKGQTSLATDN